MQEENLFPNEFSILTSSIFDHIALKNYCFPVSIGSTTGTNFFSQTSALSDWLFTLIIHGEYCFSNDHNSELSITCQKNTLIIFKPGEYFTVKGNADNCQRIWMHISGDMMPEIVKDLNIYNTNIIEFSDTEVFSILKKFNTLRNSILSRKKNSLCVASHAMLFLEQFDRNKTVDNYSLANLLKSTLDYINENFNENISVSHLAKTANISESYFIRNFKKLYGLTPYQLIMSLRFSNAVYYLKNSNKSIEEIAEICGFNDRISFSNAFTKKYGMSPMHYRNK